MQKVRQKFAYVKNLPYLCTENWFDIMKKNYIQPVVELMQMMPGSMVMAGSPTGISGGGNTQDSGIGGGAPIGD